MSSTAATVSLYERSGRNTGTTRSEQEYMAVMDDILGTLESTRSIRRRAAR